MNGLDIMEKHSSYSKEFMRNKAIECQWEEMYICEYEDGITSFITHYDTLVGCGHMRYDFKDDEKRIKYTVLTPDEFEELKGSSGFIQILPPKQNDR